MLTDKDLVLINGVLVKDVRLLRSVGRLLESSGLELPGMGDMEREARDAAGLVQLEMGLRRKVEPLREPGVDDDKE